MARSIARQVLEAMARKYGVPAPHLLTDAELRRAVQAYDPRNPVAPHVPVAPTPPSVPRANEPIHYDTEGDPEVPRIGNWQKIRRQNEQMRQAEAVARGQIERADPRNWTETHGPISGRTRIVPPTPESFRIAAGYNQIGNNSFRNEILDEITNHLIAARTSGSGLDDFFSRLNQEDLWKPRMPKGSSGRNEFLYDFFSRQGPEFKREIAGYYNPIAGRSTSIYREAFEEAINAHIGQYGDEIIKIRNLHSAYLQRINEIGKITSATPPHLIDERNKLFSRINALSTNRKNASQGYFGALRQMAFLDGEDELAHDPNFAREVTRARPVLPIFDNPMRAQIRSENLSARALEQEANIPGALNQYQRWIQSGGASGALGDRSSAILDALDSLRRYDEEYKEHRQAYESGMSRSARTLSDLHGLGAMPTSSGIGTAIRLPSGQYAGHSVHITGIVNPHTTFSNGKWIIEDTQDFIPGLGLRYRPADIVSKNLLSKIEFAQLPRTYSAGVPLTGAALDAQNTLRATLGLEPLGEGAITQPILKAFETSAGNSKVLKAAQTERSQWLKNSAESNLHSSINANEDLLNAVSRVDARYSENIAARVAGVGQNMTDATKEKLDYRYVTPSQLGGAGEIEAGKISAKNREVFASILDPTTADEIYKSRDEVTRLEKLFKTEPTARVSQAIVAARAAERSAIGRLAEGQEFTPRSVAQELIAGILFTENSGGKWRTRPYSEAYVRMMTDSDDFTKSLRVIMNQLVPGARTAPHGTGMTNKFKGLLRQAAPSLGIDATPGERNAAVNLELSYIRAENFKGGATRQVPLDQVIEGGTEGEGQAFSKASSEARLFDLADMEVPGDFIESLSARKLQQAAGVRRRAERLADLQVEKDMAQWRRDRALRAGAPQEVQRQLSRAYVDARESFDTFRRELQKSFRGRTESNEHIYAKVMELYTSAYPTLVTARTFELKNIEAGNRPGFAAEFYQHIAQGFDPRLRVVGPEEDRIRRQAYQQAQYLVSKQAVAEGRFPDVSSDAFNRRWLERIHDPIVQRTLTQIQAPPELRAWNDLSSDSSSFLFETMAKLHGWNDYTRNIFEDLLGGSNENPFFGTNSASIFEHLSTLQREGTELTAMIPGFRENYHKATGLQLHMVPESVRLRIANLQQLSPTAEGTVSSNNIAATFHVLGREGDNDLVSVMAAINYDRYVAALPAGMNPLSRDARKNIMTMASNEIKAGGSPKWTQQLEHRQFTPTKVAFNNKEAMLALESLNTLAIQQNGRPIYTANQMEDFASYSFEDLQSQLGMGWARYYEKGRMERINEATAIAHDESTGAWLASTAEGLDVGRAGGFYPVSNTGALDEVRRIQDIRLHPQDMLSSTNLRNTVTIERNAENSAVARAAIMWRNGMGIYGSKKSAVYSQLLTNPDYLPNHPLTNKKMFDVWDPILEDLDTELQGHGLNWDIVKNISESFNGIRKGGVRGIYLGETANLPADVIAAARSEMGLMEQGVNDAAFTEQFLYSPLAAGKFIQTENGPERLFDVFARARYAKTISDEDLASIARPLLGNSIAGMSREDIFEGLKNNGLDISAETAIGHIGRHLSANMNGLMGDTMLNQVLTKPEYSSIKQSIWDNLGSAIMIGQGGAAQPKVKTAAQAAKDAFRDTPALSKADIYKRISSKGLGEAWRSEPFLRKSAYGAALLGVIGLGSIMTGRNKDRTTDDMTGPAYLPGGNPYEQMPNDYMPMTYSDNPYQRDQGGTIYQVRATGSYDAQQFQNQLHSITGGHVGGTINRQRPLFNPSRGVESMQNYYG